MRKLLSLAIFLCPLLALAEPSPRQMALSQQLVGLLRMNEMLDVLQKECNHPENTSFDPKVAFKNDPGSFKGLSPQSSYWPEVVSVYDRFRSTACAYVTPDKFAKILVDQYAQRVGEKDLQAAVEFYSSPSGKRLQDATVEVNGAVSRFATDLMNQAYEAARVQFQADIHAVIQKYRREPR